MSKVNLLGYDQFGTPDGMNPLYGVGIGGGLSVMTGALIRGLSTNPSWQMNSDLAGFGAGAASAAILYATGNPAAGIAAVATAALASAARYLESKLSKPAAGVGLPVINQLGYPVVNQLGMPVINQTPHAYGTVPGAGVAGPGLGSAPPVNLLGPGSAQQTQAHMIAGPTLPRTHGLASHYGANLFGHGN